jgi:hypothetical protein
MVDLRPLFYGLAGAARLIRLDISGAKIMIGGVRGVWASLYWSAGLIAPLYLLLKLLRFDPEKHDGFRYLLVGCETYVIAWLIFPVIMERVCYFLRRQEGFQPFIIAYNWLGCLYNTMYMLVGLAHASRMISTETATEISIILMLAGIIWIGYLARHILKLPYSAALGIAILDLFSSMLVSFLSTILIAG